MNLVFTCGRYRIWAFSFKRNTLCIFFSRQQHKTVPKKTQLAKDIRASPATAAYILGKTTQLLTKHVTFYYASITHFL